MTHDGTETTRLVRDAMREAVPDAATKARVLASLQAQIAVTPDLGGPAIVTGGATKLALVVGASVLGAALVVGWPTRDEAPPASRANAPQRVDPPATDRAAVEVPAAELPASPEAIAAPVPSPRAMAPSRPRAPATVDEADPLFAESALVGRARALVDTAPAEALALCETHASRFPNGQLAIERAAIAVFVRCARGDANAEGAAEEFLTAHQDHAAAAEVRRRCARILGDR